MPLEFSKPSIEVPPEVLENILTHLEKKDLKAVRLVCKKLERSAVSLLFDEIYLSTNPAEIEIAQQTARNFGTSIKTVYFSAVEYMELNWRRFKYASRENFRAPEYARLAHTNYGKLRQEQQDMLRAGTYFGHLCFILRTIPDLESLIVTDFESSSHPRAWERRRSRLWRLGDCPAHCSIQGCAYGNLEHLSHMVGPLNLLLDYGKPSIESWSLVMMAVAATGSYLETDTIPTFTLYMPSIPSEI